jgi:hypothetical protein
MAAKKKTETKEETAAAQAAPEETKAPDLNTAPEQSPAGEGERAAGPEETPEPAPEPEQAPAQGTGAEDEPKPAPEPESVTDGVASVASLERQGSAEEALPPEHDSPPRARPEESPTPKLLTLSAAADLYRAPAWQSAALHKLMGWEPGKRVTVEEYAKALVRLKNRRLGG